jgi:hypothetical protein
MNTRAERTEKIELYGRGWDMLQEVLDEMPREMWQYKPSPKDWSIHEILVHLADSESNSYGRFRAAIAQPGLTIMAYDQDVWAVKLDYHSRSWEDALQLLRWVRKLTYDLLKSLYDAPDELWLQTIHHPERGVITLDDVLDIYADHIPGHIQQIHDNHAAWLKSKNG